MTSITIDLKRAGVQFVITILLVIPAIIVLFPGEQPFSFCIMVSLGLIMLGAFNSDTAKKNKDSRADFFWTNMSILAVAIAFGSTTALLWNTEFPQELMWLNQAAFPLTFLVVALYIHILFSFGEHFTNEV